ncbi:MAG TPA: hypothetical protein VHL79_24910 [Ramlibacter sp.]|jgi:hypothetical protein|nr:hypothetical protein [Ramlibacter sp.]
MQMKLVPLLALAAMLTACGGGGGNPGLCAGSAQVCLDGDNPNFANNGGSVGATEAVPNTSTPSTATTSSTTGTGTATPSTPNAGL